MAVNYSAYFSDPLDKVMQGEDYISRIAKGATQRQAGQRYAAGDYRGAAQTYAGAGMLPEAQSVEAQATKQFEAQQKYIQSALPVFRAAFARNGAQGITQAYQTIIPDLKRMGLGDDQIAQWGQRFSSDPEGTMRQLAAMAGRKVVFQKDGAGRLYPRYEDDGSSAGETFGEGKREAMRYVPVPRDGRVDVFDPNQQNPATPVTTGGAQTLPAPAGPVAAGAPTQAPAPVPPTAAAPAVIPQAVPPAAGAVQPQPVVSPSAMPGATQPLRAPNSPTRAMPPLSAPASAGPEYAGAGAPNRQVAGGFGAPPQPESNLPGYVGTIQGSPKPQFTPATPQQQAADPGLLGFKPDRTPVYRRAGTGTPTNLAPKEQQDLSAVRTLSRDARNIVRDMRQFIELNRQEKTGLYYNIPGSESLEKGRNPRIGQMLAILNRNVPRMRQGLPGAASDLDIQMFKSGAPSLTQTREANEAIAQQLITTAERAQSYAEFLEDWAKRNKTLRGADEEWNAYDAANPPLTSRNGRTVRARVTPWRQWFARRGTQAQQPGQAGQPTNYRYDVATGRLVPE